MTQFREFPNQLTLALPKQEKLNKPVIQFLERYGFKVERQGDVGQLRDRTRTIPSIRLEFIRAADGLLLLERGVVDMAIIGSDVVAENTMGIKPLYATPDKMKDLDIAVCKLQIAVPESAAEKYKTPADLEGLRIATSFPKLLDQWLQDNDVTPSEILVREGGVEASIRMGLADVVADLVDTGATLRQNNLVPVFDVARTSAVLYARTGRDCLTNLLTSELTRRFKQEPVGAFRTMCEPRMVA